jgi:hypothetical protein
MTDKENILEEAEIELEMQLMMCINFPLVEGLLLIVVFWRLWFGSLMSLVGLVSV